MTPLQFREARLAFGLTQSEWGLLLGIHRVQVAKIEGGKSGVTKTLALLVSAYKRHGLPAQLIHQSQNQDCAYGEGEGPEHHASK